MVSIEFIYFFIPVFMGVYAIVSPALRGKLIIVAAAVLSCWHNPLGLIPMSVSVLSGYLGGILIYNFRDNKAQKNLFLFLSLLINAAAFLLFYRSAYDNANLLGFFGIDSILNSASVLGIVVFPLHSISYCVDIYREKYSCENKFSRVAEYIAFFPALVAGPILRYDNMSETLKSPMLSSDMGAKGIRMLLVGLAEKLLLSNTMFELWNNVREVKLTDLPALSAWIGIIAFGFSMFFELSAFVNIARGLGVLMGFELPVNLDQPFTAYTLLDFFRRFNITLFSWTEEYIFNSLKKINKSRFPTFLAIVISASADMLWYGLGFRTLLFALFISAAVFTEYLLRKPLEKLPKALRRVLVLLIIGVALPLLAFKDPSDAVKYLGAMFGANRIAADLLSEYLIQTYFLFIAAAIAIVSGLMNCILKKINNISEYILTIIQPICVIGLLLICTAFIIADNGKMLFYLF